MKIVYGVQWIEVEFGQRDEGWALFTNKEECFKSTKEASDRGAGGGSYVGPERPLCAYEIPLDSLDKKLKAQLKKTGKAHTENSWSPAFHGTRHAIE